MTKSTYHISKMDCPCEERLIRMKLSDIPEIAFLNFDLNSRTLEIFHEAEDEKIKDALLSLNLGAVPSGVTYNASLPHIDQESSSTHRRTLWVVLIINLIFFLLEMSTGIISKSIGLVADSLDMLADGFVYGMSLMAVGSSMTKKKRVALYSGVLQIILAVWGFKEVFERFLNQEIVPEFRTMLVVSFLALIANSFCLWLLQRTKSKEAHIRASVIFSANDVIINIGVIVATFFVWLFNSNIPDLLIGTIIFIIVIQGAIRILKLAK